MMGIFRTRDEDGDPVPMSDMSKLIILVVTISLCLFGIFKFVEYTDEQDMKLQYGEEYYEIGN